MRVQLLEWLALILNLSLTLILVLVLILVLALILILSLILTQILTQLHERLVVEIAEVIRAGKPLGGCGGAAVAVRAIAVSSAITAHNAA